MRDGVIKNMIKAKELNENELNVLKAKELFMLEYIDNVCREQGIKYSLAAGTLLGAVRHEGFIPWDDDIDIMMLREDYEKFLLYCNKNLSDKFELVEYKKNSGYGMLFSKLMLKNTCMVEINTSKIDIPHGVFIDIFPVDKAPSDNLSRKEIFESIRTIKKSLICRSGYFWGKGFPFDILYKLKGALLRIVPKKLYIDKIEKLIDLSNEAIDYCYISYTGDVSFDRASYKKEWFDEYVDLPFEGRTFKTIKKYKEYLSVQYGNYMELPPIEMQIPHHSVMEFKVD